MATSDRLSSSSKTERRVAGIDKLLPEDEELIVSLNETYKNKFGFPFVICARENKKDSVINGLKERLQQTREEELETGVNEVKKICYFRIKVLVEN